MQYHTTATVAVAGTPVFLASVSTKADWIQVTPMAGNAGSVYLGGANQACGNGSGGTFGVILTTLGTEAGVFKGFFFPVIPAARSPYDLSKIPLNADTNGDGVVIYYGRA